MATNPFPAVNRFEERQRADEPHPVETLLRTFSYKPGWEFKAWVRGTRLALDIIAHVVDADAPLMTIRVTFHTSLDLMMVNPDFDWLRWLRSRILDVEMHEMDEFFQINGVKVFDPHKVG